MNLDAAYRVGNDQRAPDRVSNWVIRENRADPLNNLQSPIGFGNVEAESPSRSSRSGADVPELRHDLWCCNESVSPGPNRSDCSARQGVLRVGAGDEAQEDVRVSEDEH
jgi:hypothetical protein